MASSRKKQDEKNLKTLRELASVSSNKYCFDCNQRGPTYVNVTVGSFVCTKCSGMLRGLTPPHRVKSISMATFTNDEIDLLRKRGNDYCQKVWLGLYEGAPPMPQGSAVGDEGAVRDFMIEKYERRRYYLEPTLRTSASGSLSATSPTTISKQNGGGGGGVATLPTSRPRPDTRNGHNGINGNVQNTTPTPTSASTTFEADFSKANIFNGNSSSVRTPQVQPVQNGNGFANFDNNPVFSNISTATTTTTTPTSTSTGMPATTFPPINGWSYTPTTNGNNNNNNNNNSSNSLNSTFNNHNGTVQLPPPIEDKYAALKSLDEQIKSQKNNLEWTSTSSNGSLYSSPTPVSSPSPQGSIFGSPSQGQFMGTFPLTNLQDPVSNPFSNGGGSNGLNWGPTNGSQQQQTFSNPFRDMPKSNGFSHQGFHQPALFPVTATPVFVNGTNGWAPNPFKVGTTATMNSNNPFL